MESQSKIKGTMGYILRMYTQLQVRNY